MKSIQNVHDVNDFTAMLLNNLKHRNGN